MKFDSATTQKSLIWPTKWISFLQLVMSSLAQQQFEPGYRGEFIGRRFNRVIRLCVIQELYRKVVGVQTQR
jgi:hypothetical protein